MDYKLIRSKRKSIAIEIDRTGTVTVRAPYRMPNVAVKAFIEEKQDWIRKHIEKAQEMKAAGVRMLMPTFALTTVDIPALPAEIQSVFETPGDRVIFDVGGDDTGAAALGRYAPAFGRNRTETVSVLVVNCMRPLTETAEDIMDLAMRIGNRGRLGIDWIINNTNLADRTEPGMVEKGERIALECAEKMNAKTVITSGEPEILALCRLKTPVLHIRRQMVPEWMVDG